MNSKEYIKRAIKTYIIDLKYTLKEFQSEVLDELNIESGVFHGENDKEEYIEIYGDNFELKIDTKGVEINK